MALKRILILLPLLVIMMLPLEAATVSFLVAETGLRDDGKANEYSRLWENSLMEVFFEEGHIVSNSPVLRLTQKSEKEFPDEAMADLSGAIDGGGGLLYPCHAGFSGRDQGENPAAGGYITQAL